MFCVRVRIPSLRVDQRDSSAASLEPRTFPFVVSVASHALLVGLALTLPVLLPVQEPKTAYEVELVPIERKLIWNHAADELPPIRQKDQDVKQEASRGEVVSAEQPIVANPAGAEPGRQMIWQPPPAVTVHHDVPLPNMIATAVPKAAPCPLVTQ